MRHNVCAFWEAGKEGNGGRRQARSGLAWRAEYASYSGLAEQHATVMHSASTAASEAPGRMCAMVVHERRKVLAPALVSQGAVSCAWE